MLIVDVESRDRTCRFGELMAWGARALRCPSARRGADPRRRPLIHLRAAALVAVAAGLFATTPVRAQSGEHIAVVINEASADSVEVGEYYIRQRGIPPGNVIRIRTTSDDVIDRSTFAKDIEEPMATYLSRGHLQDRIQYIVLTKGVPLRIAGVQGRDGTTASVDSELTLLYRQMVGDVVLTRGTIDNPYFLGTRGVADAQRFTHRDHDIFLVSRLDAFTTREAIALVDRCNAPSAAGHIVLDQRGEVANRLGDAWLEEAALRLEGEGHADIVQVGATPKLPGDALVAGYYSWGSTDPQNRSRTVGMKFVPGALAATFVSTDARTFREPPAEWVPTEQPNRSTWFSGSGQSLTGDLIRQGVSGVAGHVSEPYLQSAVRPDILFSAYLAGFNLVESFYLALPHLSWQTVIVGDPLCRIAARPELTSAELDPGLDPETEEPLWFAERQTRRFGSEATGMPARALNLWVRAENFIARKNPNSARLALEEATRIAPQMIGAQLKLAEIYTNEGKYDQAIERYRATLSVKPDHVVALNNLAYAIAVDRKEPQEALPLARRAVVLARNDGSVIDTLAWVEYLAGDSATAAKRIAEAVRRKPEQADIRLHAAIIYAAVDALGQAKVELAEALRLSPALATREDVGVLRTKLEGAAPKP